MKPVRSTVTRSVRLLAVAGILAVTGLSSCVVVKPYQREDFAKLQMTFDPDPLELSDEIHTLQAREGAAGGYGLGGGGCGCN
jgi:hypothetical protein